MCVRSIALAGSAKRYNVKGKQLIQGATKPYGDIRQFFSKVRQTTGGVTSPISPREDSCDPRGTDGELSPSQSAAGASPVGAEVDRYRRDRSGGGRRGGAVPAEDTRDRRQPAAAAAHRGEYPDVPPTRSTTSRRADARNDDERGVPGYRHGDRSRGSENVYIPVGPTVSSSPDASQEPPGRGDERQSGPAHPLRASPVGAPLDSVGQMAGRPVTDSSGMFVGLTAQQPPTTHPTVVEGGATSGSAAAPPSGGVHSSTPAPTQCSAMKLMKEMAKNLKEKEAYWKNVRKYELLPVEKVLDRDQSLRYRYTEQHFANMLRLSVSQSVSQ
eukprot:GHVU01055947.1.p1 GENE.GHVU01055947.1~~GHVU01055947.1.p1  ORF type:complete len:328 (+),score=34.91 GHVU01055947.1:1147-2130(+)